MKRFVLHIPDRKQKFPVNWKVMTIFSMNNNRAYLQQFAFSRVREGWKHSFILLRCKLLNKRVKVRLTLSTQTKALVMLTFAFSMSTQK